MIEDLNLASSSGWRLAAAQGRLAAQRQEDDETTYRLGLEASDLRPGTGLRTRLDPSALLPAEVERVHLDVTVTFDAPLDRNAVEQARPQPRRIDIEDLSARWGELELRAAGTLDVGRDGLPVGAVIVKATNWREMVQVSVNAGLVPAALSGTVEKALEVLAGLSGAGDTLDVPLSFKGGRVSIGPVPLGPAPRLILR